MKIFLSVLHCFDYHGLILNFKIKMGKFFSFVLFQDGFGYSVPLEVLYFRMSFSISIKNCHWDFDEDLIETVDSIHNIDILTTLRFPM